MLVVIVIILFWNQHYIPRTSGIILQLFSNVIKGRIFAFFKGGFRSGNHRWSFTKPKHIEVFGFGAEKHP